MTQRVAVFVYAADPISQAGLASQLRSRPEVLVVEEGDLDEAVVAVVMADEVDEDTARVIRAAQRNGCPRVVVVVTRLDDSGLLAAIEAGACGILRRADALPERLAEAVLCAAAGDGSVPPDLLGRLLDQVGRLQRQVLAPRGLTLSGLSSREVEVLRLVAEGLDTAEIAGKLAYSERTVKNVIHDVTTRLQLRNRSHAVAFAVRQGLI
ncbi:MAG: LuxR C-terminal-related transcriptional regulator [Acidimicrobiales bacterium]